MAAPSPRQHEARVTRAVREYRRRIIAQERDAQLELARAYRDAYDRLVQELNDAIAGAKRAEASGRPVNTFRIQRAIELTRQAEQLFGDLTRKTGGVIDFERRRAANQAFQSAGNLLDTVMGPPPPTLPNASSFMQFPHGAIETITGQLVSGPVNEVLARYGVEKSEEAGQILTGAIASGVQPQAIVKQLQKLFNVAHYEAARIARTEINRAYRESLRATWQANKHIVPRWEWVSGRKSSTCAVCWAMDGREFDSDEPMGTHPNCRCCLSPVPISWADLAAIHGFTMPPGDWDSPKMRKGPEVFAGLDPTDQEKVLGRHKFAHYQAGNIELRDLVRVRTSEDWGVTRSEGSLKVALERSKKRNGGTLPGGPVQQPLRRFLKRQSKPAPAQPAPASFAPQLPKHWNGSDAGDPQGLSVAAFLNPDKDAAQWSHDALDAINQVHGVHDLGFGPIRVRVEQSPTTNGHYGYHSITGEPGEIMVTSGNTSPRLTILHEIGHMLDYTSAGPWTESNAMRDKRWRKWQVAVSRSQLYKDLQHVLQTQDGRAWDAAEYNVRTKELWARSYAQYVAAQAGNPEILQEMAGFMVEIKPNSAGVDINVPRQWDEADFQPIGDVIYEIFQDLGWQK